MTTSMSDTGFPSGLRAAFPALNQLTYLDVAARCVLSRATRAALDAHLDDHMLRGGDKSRFLATVERVRTRFAELIHADATEIAMTKNISEGLNMVATGIDWRPGDNVVVCPELEHPNNVYPWLNLRSRGVDVRFVKSHDGSMPVEDMIAAMDARTRCLTASSVSLAPGFRTDVDTLGDACRARGVLFLVDAAQSVGIMHTDVRASKIDALAVSTQKGLLGPYGMGFLYVRREWADTMHPAYLARFGVDVGQAHEAALGDHEFKLAAGARRFDLGNYNFAAAAAVDASIVQLLDLGTPRIEQYVTGLSRALAQGFLDLGMPVVGGAPGAHLANIVTVGTISANYYGTDDDRFNRLYAHLGENNVRLSLRRGMLRFSFHAYNNMDDVARVLELSREFMSAS
ncbi:MAG: aminotransferase class V-fold PLP-dependent enzyme [bacterium]